MKTVNTTKKQLTLILLYIPYSDVLFSGSIEKICEIHQHIMNKMTR